MKSCLRASTDSRNHCAMQLEFCTNTETVKSFDDATQTDKAPALRRGGVCEPQCIDSCLFLQSLWQLWKFEVEKGLHVNNS